MARDSGVLGGGELIMKIIPQENLKEAYQSQTEK